MSVHRWGWAALGGIILFASACTSEVVETAPAVTAKPETVTEVASRDSLGSCDEHSAHQVAYVAAEKRFVICDAGHWRNIDVELAPGPKGEDGAPGAMGPVGPAGATGQAGADGANGSRGPVGQTGPAGERGAQGAPGAPGADGAQGETGFTSLATVTQSDACPAGGLLIRVGVDRDRDNFLDPEEVTSASIVCTPVATPPPPPPP